MSWFAVERPTGRIAAQGVAFVVSRGVLLLATVATARTAGVQAYGVFALALVVFQAGILLRDAGLGQALIVLGARERGLTLVSSVVISGVGIALAVVMAGSGGALTGALGLPGAGPTLAILALAFAIGSFGIASSATLERELRFVARASIDVISYGALGLLTLLGLSRGMGVDSLAWAFVGQAVVQSGLAIVVAPPWTDRGGSLSGVLRMARYSSLLWAAAGLSYLAANIDNALVGRLAGASALGVYALSYTIGNTITIGVAQVLNRVALPYYGRAHRDPVAVERIIRTILPLSVILAAIPATVIIALGPEIVGLVFDPGSSTIPVTLLAIYGVVRAVGMSLGTALNGTGGARASVAGSALNIGLMAVLIPIGLQLAGPAGVAAVVLVSIAASTVYLEARLERHLGLRLRAERLRLVVGVAVGTTVALIAPQAPVVPRLVGGAVVIAGLLAAGLRVAGWHASPDRRAADEMGERR